MPHKTEPARRHDLSNTVLLHFNKSQKIVSKGAMAALGWNIRAGVSGESAGISGGRGWPGCGPVRRRRTSRPYWRVTGLAHAVSVGQLPLLAVPRRVKHSLVPSILAKGICMFVILSVERAGSSCGVGVSGGLGTNN